jgi:imidazole glycerol-phosphate synthase subunit HisH
MVVIVDFKMGNLGSILNIIKKAGESAVISSDKETILKASKLILPGVGHFEKAMKNLQSLQLIDVLNEAVLINKTPILGICLGMQLLTKFSEEGGVNGLGWINAKTIKFAFQDGNNFKSVHMGWNHVDFRNSIYSILYNETCPRFYFVHSYFVECENEENVLCTTEYEKPFTSGIIQGHIMGVQFHPEKSHQYGLELVKKFIYSC